MKHDVEWHKRPRHLQFPSISWDGKPIQLSNNSDHANPGSWDGDVSVNSTTTVTPWKDGRKRVESDDEIVCLFAMILSK